jgi:hypothetical protein
MRESRIERLLDDLGHVLKQMASVGGGAVGTKGTGDYLALEF